MDFTSLKSVADFTQAFEQADSTDSIEGIIERFIQRNNVMPFPAAKLETVVDAYIDSEFRDGSQDLRLYQIIKVPLIRDAILDTSHSLDLLNHIISNYSPDNRKFLMRKVENNDPFFAENREVIFDLWVKAPEKKMRLALAMYVECDDKHIEELSRDEYFKVRQEIASKSFLSEDIKLALLEDEDESVREAVVGSNELSQEEVQKLSEDPSIKLKVIFAKEGDFSSIDNEKKLELFQSDNTEILDTLAENETMSEDDLNELLKCEKLSNDARAIVRRRIRQANPISMKSLASRLSTKK